MKITWLGVLLALATLSTTLPRDQSREFVLVIVSQDSNYNNSTVIPCEKGKQRPFPGLCPLANLSYGIFPLEFFNLNYTSSSGADENIGYLTYELINRSTASGPANQSASMQLNNKDSYSVPLFGYAQRSDATLVEFNNQNKLGVLALPDQTGKIPVASTATFNKWHICDIDSGIVYPSLVWATSESTPSLPSCIKVDIIRVFP
ncbi:hypothetical protein GQ53DRAFT_823637 [Thozetella sp. PMI_491]|nr:hypothetical protein GQ53DRAFT_823637 [Thozetella sp. PMI_491]